MTSPAATRWHAAGREPVTLVVGQLGFALDWRGRLWVVLLCGHGEARVR